MNRRPTNSGVLKDQKVRQNDCNKRHSDNRHHIIRKQNIIKKEDEGDYKLHKSKASCKLKDIQGIIYGGQSSRFWLYRKFIVT